MTERWGYRRNPDGSMTWANKGTCEECSLLKKENERLWHELDVLLKMVEKHSDVIDITIEGLKK